MEAVKKAAIEAGAFGCTISGAGPTAVAVTDDEETGRIIGLLCLSQMFSCLLKWPNELLEVCPASEYLYMLGSVPSSQKLFPSDFDVSLHCAVSQTLKSSGLETEPLREGFIMCPTCLYRTLVLHDFLNYSRKDRIQN
ncbi:homoserine kinase [Olea europaea subsp. europaea]|uniref:Homoserine kinase n=1 Tax=Olea europaea subsp. europaea TaxID=158383 RepID=A0A8S0Q0K8_OLEEU|nr:homoserine kinase [Olea europaea subsp. europaea]